MANRLSLCLALILFLSSSAVGRQREAVLVAKTYKSTQGRTMPYRLLVPENYQANKRYPLVLFLHGGGGRGVDNVKQIQGGNGFIIDLLIKPESQARSLALLLLLNPSRKKAG